jgi:hypothetical protein
MDQGPPYQTQSSEVGTGKHRKHSGSTRYVQELHFLNRTAVAHQLRERMDKWDFIKLKCFCTTKEMVSKLKGLPTHRVEENICQVYLRQRTVNQNIEGTQKTKLSTNQ